jgi:PhoH-like ATPase
MKRVVLDSNIVLLDATNILTLGKDAIVVLPEIVLKEVDNKKTGFNELAYQARQMGRILATFDVQYTSNQHSGLTITTLHNSTDKVTVEVVSLDKYVDIDPNDSGANDQKIIQIAQKMQALHENVKFITNDVLARIRAVAVGLDVTDLKLIDDAEFEFTKELVINDPEVFKTLHDTDVYRVDPKYKLENYSYKFTDELTGQIKLATVNNGFLKVLGKDTGYD